MIRKNLLTTLLLLSITLMASAIDLGQYYAQAKGLKGKELKTALAGIIYRATAVTDYAGLKQAYTKTDVRSDGYLNDMYSCITAYVPGSNMSNYQNEGDTYNREHTIPQSIFSKAAPMVSDLFHVYPVDGKINGVRSDYCHGDVGTAKTYSEQNYSVLGSPSTTLQSEGCAEKYVFEPADEWKGDIARTYFYFVTCYESKLTTFKSYGAFSGDTYPSLTAWAQDCYITWSENDQVSEWETTRNENVYNYPTEAANNRNPFIDFPGLEQYIWGYCQDEPFDPDNYRNPYQPEIAQGDVNGDGNISISDTTLLIQILNARETASLWHPDVNTDGDVNLGDLNTQVAWLLGKK